ELLLVSRFRDRMARAFRFVAADADLVEALVDKARFQELAARLDLPVPRAHVLHPEVEPCPAELAVRLPCIVKPLTRRVDRWEPVGSGAKAIRVDTLSVLRALWPLLAEARAPVLAQELVPGPETLVESYHVYVDPSGDRVADFTGRKIRTYPLQYGDSTALIITDAPDVATLGRDVVRRLARLGAAQRSLARIRLGRPAAPRRRRTVAPRIATGITDPSWPRRDARATGDGPRAMSTTLAPPHVTRPASLAAAPAECGPMVNPVVRWALYLFVFSIPFEMPQRSIPLETTTITAALFLLTTPLERRACYGRIPSALLWFGGWLWVFVIAALVGSQQYAQLALQLLAQLGELLLLCWAAGNLMRDRRVFRAALMTLVVACALWAALEIAGIG